MEIDAAKLAADGLRLTFDGPRGTQRRIGFAPSGGISGKYVSDSKATVIEAHSRQELAVAEMLWPLESGEVRLEGTATLLRPVINLTIPRGKGGTRGEVASGEINIGAVVIALSSMDEPIVITDLTLRKAGLALDGKGFMAIVAEEMSATRITFVSGGTEIALDGVTLAQVRIRKSRKGRWTIDALALEATKMAVHVGHVGIVINDLAVGRMAWETGGELSIGELEAPVVHIHHSELTTTGKRAKSDDKPNTKTQKKTELDLSALDNLNGKIDVDLTADTTVPVVGSRRATHHFRLKVDHGTINYYRLEKSLSKLEDALLDFEVHGNKLVLVVDLALRKKPIVSWHLDHEEVALAHKRLVRLRRLIEYEIAGGSSSSSKRGSSSKPAIAVRELLFDNIDIVLKMIGGGVLKLGRGLVHLGAGNRSAIGQMRVVGRICHRPKGEQQRGRLELTAEKLHFGAENVRVGSQRLDMSALRVGAIEKAELRFAGVRPTTLEAKLRELAIEELRLTR